MRRLMLCVFFSLVASACGDDGGALTGSCEWFDFADELTLCQYYGSVEESAGDVAQICNSSDASDWTTGTDKCDSTGALTGCEISVAGSSHITEWYFAPWAAQVGLSEAEATAAIDADCVSRGGTVLTP